MKDRRPDLRASLRRVTRSNPGRAAAAPATAPIALPAAALLLGAALALAAVPAPAAHSTPVADPMPAAHPSAPAQPPAAVAASGSADGRGSSTGALESAAALIAAERFEEAMALLDQVLADDPGAADALALRAEARRRADRLDSAAGDYRRLTELRPGEADAWFWLGTIHRWRGRSAEAIAAFDELLALAPGHPGALVGRARVRMELGRLESAVGDLRRVLEAHPDHAEAARLLAEARAALGNPEAARETLRAAFRGTELELELGDLELANGRPEAALEHYRRAAAARPGEAAIHRRVGDAERARGRGRAALEAYGRAAELAPDDIGSLYWVGVLATRAGRPDRALAAWEAILAREPHNVAALVGKGRILHHDGAGRPALTYVNRALDVDPANGEALTLRASILSAAGRLREAGADYEAVLASDPDNVDARLGYRRYSESDSWGLRGLSDDSRVVEGLDDEGAVVNGVLIRPTRIQYLTGGVEAFARSPIGARTGLGLTLSQRREAVTNLDSGAAIYDFDVLEGLAGLDHHLSDRWRLSWRLGGRRYEPRESGSIAEQERFAGETSIEWRGRRSRLSLDLEQAPFVYRGFAGDTQFEIFDRRALGLAASRELGGAWELAGSASAADFDGEERQLYGHLGLRWQRAERRVAAGLHHTPFPERFLTDDGELAFLDLDAAYLQLETPIALGFRLTAEAEHGRIGPAPRLVEVGGILVDGPEERNERLRGHAQLAWSPRRFAPLSLGAEVRGERFDSRSSRYNTLDSDETALFVALAGGRGGRLRYEVRASRALVSDDRDDDYDRDDLYLRLEGDVGGGALWLGLEGRLTRATLEGSTESYDEERPWVKAYLRVAM